FGFEEEKLSVELSEWLEQVPVSPEDGSLASAHLPINGCRAIIAPHAGYSYSGLSAAYAYKCIDPLAYDRIFILGPSHHKYLDGCALSQCSEYETPMGNLKIDQLINKQLKESGQFTTMSVDVDEDEHSIEMHLPYIYYIMERKGAPFTIIPILVGSINSRKEELYGQILSPFMKDPRNLFIASSDFCHWGARFSYVYRIDRVTPIYKSIEKVDRGGMELIENMNIDGFQSYLKKTNNTICGRHPILVLMYGLSIAYTSEENPEIEADNLEVKFLTYAQSSKVISERESSVSYASAYFSC
ncbi:hypothetical protein HK096_010765, partial [Nowakowskiella sp. JEL0078]